MNSQNWENAGIALSPLGEYTYNENKKQYYLSQTMTPWNGKPNHQAKAAAKIANKAILNAMDHARQGSHQ